MEAPGSGEPSADPAVEPLTEPATGPTAEPDEPTAPNDPGVIFTQCI